MAILGNLIARSLKIRKKFRLQTASPITYQEQTLKRLLETAQYTAFGRRYGFSQILDNETDLYPAFRERVPIHSYNEIFAQWWHRCLEGEENVTWPGKVRYFALSSGTSESSSKHIPVTMDMIRSIKKVGFRQLYSLVDFDLPPKTFSKGVLMLGGTTSLYEKGGYYEGDMSGISAKNMPKWMSSFFYKPGQRISRRPQWEDRIRLIVRKARDWDVGTVCGVPAWVQIVLEEVIAYHQVKHIHEIWPNLNIYIHGGVAFEPYKRRFAQLLGRPITYIETYMASEGSFGFQARPGNHGIKLVLNTGLFYEFIPFRREYFDENGNLLPNPKTLTIDQVVEGEEYALLVSTCAGAWRYLMGDVLRFTDAGEHEIQITGRTREFLSLCGEHTSVENMYKAIETLSQNLDISIREFSVAGFSYENLFAHRWYIGCDEPGVSAREVRDLLDKTLCEINDDYAVERTSALKEVFVELIPTSVFYEYLKSRGKGGAMNKVPRVLRNQRLEDWESYLKANGVVPYSRV